MHPVIGMSIIFLTKADKDKPVLIRLPKTIRNTYAVAILHNEIEPFFIGDSITPPVLRHPSESVK